MAKKSTKRADGRLVRTITDPRTGKRKYFYGETEREINKKILEYTTSAESGRTFQEVAEEWWKDTATGLAAQTKKVYRPALKRAIAHFGDSPINDIKPRAISLFLQLLGKSGMQQKTVLNNRTVIKQIFDRAVIECEIDANPCASVQTPKNLKKEKRTAATAFDERIVRENRDLWIFPYIALLTGMRRGEILALQWGDIDFNESLIYVTKSAEYVGNRPNIKAPKTEAGIRIVPLLDELKDFLQKQPNKSQDHYVVSEDGGRSPLSHGRYQRLYKDYVEKTGISCTAHQLRHSFATIAFESGVDAKAIQTIIGHRQLSTTMDLYTDFRKKSLESAAKKLNESLNKND
jgi:integrase